MVEQDTAGAGGALVYGCYVFWHKEIPNHELHEWTNKANKKN
jgi:hypothetical protein